MRVQYNRRARWTNLKSRKGRLQCIRTLPGGFRAGLCIQLRLTMCQLMGTHTCMLAHAAPLRCAPETSRAQPAPHAGLWPTPSHALSIIARQHLPICSKCMQAHHSALLHLATFCPWTANPARCLLEACRVGQPLCSSLEAVLYARTRPIHTCMLSELGRICECRRVTASGHNVSACVSKSLHPPLSVQEGDDGARRPNACVFHDQPACLEM